MRTSERPIRTLQPQEWAIGMAKLCYQNWQAKLPKEKRIKFEDELMDYLCTGFVTSRPTMFTMMKIIDVAEELPEGTPGPTLAWFLRVAIGDLREVTEAFPLRLPWLAFCRHGDPKLRLYPMDRAMALAMKFGGITVDEAMAKLLRGEIRCIKKNAD